MPWYNLCLEDLLSETRSCNVDTNVIYSVLLILIYYLSGENFDYIQYPKTTCLEGVLKKTFFEKTLTSNSFGRVKFITIVNSSDSFGYYNAWLWECLTANAGVGDLYGK